MAVEEQGGEQKEMSSLTVQAQYWHTVASKHFIEQSTSHVEANIRGAEKYTRYTLFIVEALVKSRGKVHRYREGADLGTVVLFITSGKRALCV